MASPYSTGGGGTHFEARVAASYLAAILCESPARGVPGQYAVQALTQRAAFDEPLDDVILTGLLENGAHAKLHLQIKSDLKFTANDPEWVSILQQAWDTFQGIFDSDIDRLGVAVSTYSARADKHYQSVLKWAAHSVSGQHFIERIEKKDYAHKDKRAFVDTTRSILSAYAAKPIDDDMLWRFLSRFVILHFDFIQEGSSRDSEGVCDRLRNLLSPDQRQEADALWDYLVATAGELIPAGGGATRKTLVQRLQSASKPTGTASSFWRDLQAINQESKWALSDIKSDIHGLHLHRHEAYEQVKQALAEGRFIQIDGEPGTGKSALLRDIAEESSRTGPIFVLKDSRIQPRGWSAHAHVLSVSSDATALLRELGTSGESILFIDGIDKISDPAVQLTVNDLVRVIAGETDLSDWKILATVREQNLEHIATWLDPDALKKLPVRTATVKPLERHELGVVSEYFPRIHPLLLEPSGTDVILRKPFFLESILALSGRKDTSKLPATEVELLKLWWQMGGSERADFSPAQRRRNVLLDLANRLAHASNVAISIKDIEPEALDELKSAGVLRDKELGHSVVFTHDIYEEWALTEYLIGKQPEVTAFLREVEEPQALVRPMQLLGAYVLEANTTELEWKALYEKVSDDTLRPVWQRTVLTSCLQSTRTTQLLGKLDGYLTENDNKRLKRLLIALRTIEVVPNPIFLNEKLIPDLAPDERVQFAHQAALPKPLKWIRFLDWFMTQPELPWPTLIPDLLPVFETWQKAYAGQKIRYCHEIGEVAHRWLVEFETARHQDQFEDLRRPFGIEIAYEDEDKVEGSIRSLFLSSAGDVPELVTSYLKEHGSGKRQHMFRDKIMSDSTELAKHVPADLVDFILKTFLEHPKDRKDKWGVSTDHLSQDLGLVGHLSFYPASPVQPPFLILLRAHEAEGLRLVRALCNHSVAVWQWVQKNRGRHSEPVTPIPIDITFPWGVQRFWGNGQVYLWFRGSSGNSAVGSALMALEQWALEQIEGGRSFEDLFRKVLEGNESVAALGLALSLCLAHQDKSIECSLPLVTCPHLWGWDIARFSQDAGGMPANEIGNWHTNHHQLKAVRALNRRPHRKLEIRSLVPCFVLHSDKGIKKRYTTAVRKFTKRLPFDVEEEKKIPGAVAELRERMQLYVEQADPKYWKVEPTEDGKSFQIWNDPPLLKAEKYVRQREQHDQLNEHLGLGLWASKCLETATLDTRFTIEEAIARAKALDATDLFEQQPAGADYIHEQQRQAAVAGTAFVAAQYYEGKNWGADVAPWCFDVLRRSAATPEPPDALTMRSSIMSMHPVIFAAHGHTALLVRSYEIRKSQIGLLNLAVAAAESVVEAVAVSAERYAAKYPHFYWVLLDLLIRQCIVRKGEVPNFYSMVWDEKEAEHKLALLNAAEQLLNSGNQPTLPNIPLPWIKRGDPDPSSASETGGYERNDTTFLWNLAEKTIFNAPLDLILSDTAQRHQFVRLVGQLVALTIQEIVPPFAKSRRDHHGNTPFEWVFAMFNWCGRLSTQLTPEEVRAEILSPVLASDNDTALLAMQSFVPAYMINSFLPPAVIKDDQLSLWNEITNWIFENNEGKRARDHIGQDFSCCALATLFCVHRDFGPVLCGVEEGWPHLRRFEAVLKRAVCQFGKNSTLYIAVSLFFKKGGFDLLPDPGLDWLQDIAVEMKQDQEFWRSNGDDTVEILKMILERKESLLDPGHRKTISLISDILVDNGVRGAGILQQNHLRAE